MHNTNVKGFLSQNRNNITQRKMRYLATLVGLALVLFVALLALAQANAVMAKDTDTKTSNYCGDAGSTSAPQTENNENGDAGSSNSETKLDSATSSRSARALAPNTYTEETIGKLPANIYDQNDCINTRSAKSDTRSLGNGETEVPLIRTITEGESTTFTAPIPSDRQLIKHCANYVDKNYGPSPEFRSDGTLVCKYSGSSSAFGVCNGPYTVDLITRDNRVQAASGSQRISVTTSTSDNLDDSGSLEIVYLLRGTRTGTFQRYHQESAITSVFPCAFTETVRVEVQPAPRPGMSAAVARHAPSEEYLNTPSTVTWTCTQAIIDTGVQCELSTVISKTTTPTFPTPLGCVVVVTATDRGHGSTGCLPSDQAAGFGEMIGVDIDSLPDCPEDIRDLNEEDTSGRKRCVVRN